MNWLLLTLWILIIGTTAGFLLKKKFPWVGHILLALMILYGGIITAGTVICWDAPETSVPRPNYAVVLGCALEDGEATEELIRRCSLAKFLMDGNEKLTLIVSGGDPGGQGRTEAEVMAAWLRNHGADPDRLLIEDQASDTRENLLFSKALAEEHGLGADGIIIVTSEYHQTRAQYLAGKLGQQATGFSCKTPMPDHLFAAVREAYAFLKAIVETM
ncbi:MAG: YdcF family protein [Clostridia bacterium]|nr:YdcF family protein [Clostridia bacterium]